ncbi:siderochrome-iron transporter [Microdochium bolleyi]|uniref:Siderochrome-iron transporter n=1 Tax=Microdochium bolleyi TaxID=196109 RepID=A0A136J002_9PEZI|nr:siderochrome-iron transporter [Microdochium bolleyi]
MAAVPEKEAVAATGATTAVALPPAYGHSVNSDDAHHDKPGDKSPGVIRVEALSSVMTTTDRYVVFFSVFLVAYAYGLDGTLRYTYQNYATADFGEHSLLSSINVLKAVIAAVSQPTFGKIADVFGRVELVCVSVFFYIIGTIVQTVATDTQTFAGGSVLNQLGYSSIILLVEVIIADITSTRARLLFSYIPALPFLINTWVSGDVAAAVLASTTWRWGIGMWCIIYTACALPLIISLSLISRRARKMGKLDGYHSLYSQLGIQGLLVELFWRLDVIGIILMIAVFALILVPLTIAGGFTVSWDAPQVIAPLVLGVVCIPVFIFSQLKAPHPLVPFSLAKDRGVWAPLGIAMLLNFAWYMQGDYLYTVLIVNFDFDIKTATRVSSLYSFVSVITGFLLGLVVFKVRRLKIFIVIGTMLFMVSFGLLIHFRGDAGAGGKAGVIAAECLLGFAGGMFPYPAQASIQAGLKHENLAVMTGLYLALYSIGSALGNAVAGAIWTQVLPGSLSTHLAPINATLAATTFADPFTTVALYPIGTPERTAIIEAYQGTQKLLCIAGLCLCIPLIGFAAALRNPKLSDAQNLSGEQDKSTVVNSAA